MTISWNVIAGHLAALEAEGILNKLISPRSTQHTVRYTTGKKAGKIKTRGKTHALF